MEDRSKFDKDIHEDDGGLQAGVLLVFCWCFVGVCVVVVGVGGVGVVFWTGILILGGLESRVALTSGGFGGVVLASVYALFATGNMPYSARSNKKAQAVLQLQE